MARRQTLPGQLTLPLTRDDRLAIVDDVDPSVAGVSVRAWRSIRELLRQVEFCSGRSGCHARVDVLAARMGVTGRTVRRARQAAEVAGLLRVEPTPGRSHLWAVSWTRLASARSKPHTAQVSGPPDVLSAPPGRTVRPPGQDVRPVKEYLENVKEPTTPDSVVGEIFAFGIDQAARAVQAARSQGATEDAIRAVVAEWRTRSDHWAHPEAALYRRLMRWRPDLPPSSGWPAPRDAVLRAERRARTKYHTASPEFLANAKHRRTAAE